MQTSLMISPYDPQWPVMYEAARAEIEAAIGDDIVRIEHVGSTSVPGLAAKPTIDVLAGVRNWDEAKVTIAPMSESGWECAGEYGIPRRHYFRRRDERGFATHHLHMLEVGSPRFDDHLSFRDHLRAHADVAAAYERLKHDLARRMPGDSDAYQQGKGPFIEGVLERARRQRPNSRIED